MPDSLNSLYLNQIAAAQEFLNENRKADISRVKCLLHKMLPREYFDAIESLKEQQDTNVIFQINGGNNIMAPKALTAQQTTPNVQKN